MTYYAIQTGDTPKEFFSKMKQVGILLPTEQHREDVDCVYIMSAERLKLSGDISNEELLEELENRGIENGYDFERWVICNKVVGRRKKRGER